MSDNENEQSFNEDELKDIMDEIESLEEDYGEVEAAAKDNSEDSQEEVHEEVQHEQVEDEEVIAASDSDDDEHEVASAETIDEPVIAEPVAEEAPHEQEVAAAHDKDDQQDDSDEVEQILDDDDDDDDDVDTVAQPGEEAVTQSNVVELAKPAVSAPTTDAPVQLNAQGQMNLAMNFEFNGAQSQIVLENGSVKINLPGVDVVFDEKSGCQITADNGMTFRLPLAVKKAS